TTICRCLLEQIPDQANVALVLNPKLNEIELLETICDELKISYPDSSNSIKTYTDRIYDFLIKSNQKNEKTVLIIDEAQNLDSKVLEQLRLLTNLETNQRKLLQIIILGQPELLDILATTEMRQLAQRITARFHLQPLTKHEVKAYINHRLAVAGQNIQLFPENSIKLLYKLSNGVPRLINVICDRALLGAYVENQYTVNPSILKKAATEVFGELKNVEQKQKNKQRLYPIAVFFSFLILAFVVVSYFKNNTEIAGNSPQDIIVSDIKNESSSTYSEAIIQTSLDNLPAEKISIEQTSEAQDVTTDDSIQHSNTDTTETFNTIKTQPAKNPSMAAIDTEYDDINEILNDDSNNPASAYLELFKTWGLDYNDKTSITACKQAKTYSLSCLYRHGNLNNLKAHNRPAVLTVTNNQGVKRYITITSIDKNLATVFSNNKAYTVKLDDIDKHWYGSFILLWRKPEHYSSAITPGDSGDIITWLNTQLVKINKTPLAEIISVYDDYLIEKVKTFQLQQGLTADGIVGPVTIIHINTQSGIKAPSLKPSPVNPIMKQN
ncbi:MAG: AAA family ATPase, partial [Gammaproteobacteria bacterium]|nr:AAA family ATPase [Gammaproteobacteria bacterium]